MDNKDLEKYIGWRFNKMTINTIEYEFYPYKVIICDIKDFNGEGFLDKKIRSFVIEGLIKDIKFN
jgi:hypothetical protein